MKRMTSSYFYLVVMLLAVLVATIYSNRAQAAASDFYKGKTIVLIVTYSPGGGYDIYARALAPYLKKYTGANVVVKNMPGAGGLLAAGYLYNTAKPDGLTIEIASASGFAISAFLKEPGVKFDLKKFRWLGRTCDYNELVVVNGARPYKSIQDLRRAPVIKFGATVRTISYGYNGAVFAYAAGLDNLRIIPGYGGASEMTAALLRGETDGEMLTATAGYQFIKSGDLYPIVSMSMERLPAFPNVQTIFEAVPDMPPEIKRIVTKMITVTNLQRAFVTAPGVPDDRVAFLSFSLKKALEDPELLKDVKNLGLLEPVRYAPGDELLKEMNEAILALTPQEMAVVRDLILEKYK